MQENLLNIWNIIVESNTFNFIFFVIIIAYVLLKKLDIRSIIAKLQSGIVDTINKSKEEKEKAVSELDKAKKTEKSVPKELEKILSDAQKNADNISKNILEDGKLQVLKIEQNTKKLIEADQRAVMSELIKATSQEAIKLAETKLTEALKQDRALHDKFIENSINELDGLKF